MASRESTPVLLADNLKKYVESCCPPPPVGRCPPTPGRQGHSGSPSFPGHSSGGTTSSSSGSTSGQGLVGRPLDGSSGFSRVEMVVSSLDGRVQNVVLDFSFFPKVKVHWCNKGHLREQVIELQENAVFLGIRCPKCKRLVTAVTLLRGIRCSICTSSMPFYSSPKKIVNDLRKAHALIEKYDPFWEGLQAFGKHEWLDGY